MLHSIRKLPLFAGLAAVALVLSACDPEEQDRILRYEKGTYLGQPDEELSPDVQNALRARVRYQRGV